MLAVAFATPMIRKVVGTVLALAAVAWCAAQATAQTQQAGDGEKFVPGSPRYLAGATLELRGEASVIGQEVKLKQVCRWSEGDRTAFEPIADLVVLRLGAGAPYRALSLEDLKATLHDAGVNLAVIRFAGTRSCTINRADVQVDERVALEQWINARQPPAASQAQSPATQPAEAQVAVARYAEPTAKPQAAADDPQKPHSLRDLLLIDLSERVSLPVEVLQVRFNPQDEKLLSLAEPVFQFNVDGHRIRNLGDITWDVTVVAGAGTHKTSVAATARAWQEQLFVVKPMAFHQVFRDEDLQERRALVDRVADEPMVARRQVVGQMAANDLKAGTILTPRLVEATPLARPGDLITVTLRQGNVQIKTVARAIDGGSYGQGIKVRNEVTREVFDVTLTSPQAGTMSPTASNLATTKE